MAHVLIVLILLGIWLLIGFPRRNRASGCLRRTPKWKIIFRMGIIPFAVVAFWGLMFCTADPEIGLYFVLGGVGAILGAIGFLWGFTNICTFLSSPTYYRLWKKGGGDPYFDSVDPPFNTDSDDTRYQELFKEAVRQQAEDLFPPPAPPDFTKGIDDPNII